MKVHAGWDALLIGLFAITLFMFWQKAQENQMEEMAERTSLHPEVEEMKQEFIHRTSEQGIDVVIIEGYRTEKKQNDLYAQGRSEKGNVVTRAKGGESYHNYGLAVDFALRKKNGKLTWNTGYDGNENGTPDWQEAADIAKAIGFEWGGDWRSFRDPSHLQWSRGISIKELKRQSSS